MKFKFLFIACMAVFVLPVISASAELRTRLVRVEYQEKEQLLQLNRQVRLGLSNSMGRFNSQITAVDDVSNKIDLIYGRVQEILDMHMPKNGLKIILLSDGQEVQKFSCSENNRHEGYPVFYSSEKNSLYLVLDKVDTRMLAHGLAHAVMSQFFQMHKPERIQEMLAQYVERQFIVSAKKKME